MRARVMAAVGAAAACAVAAAASIAGCGSGRQDRAAAAPLVDLTAASSLEAVRLAFNAHRGEARFLTLLSPT